jgi:hypothetical protein
MRHKITILSLLSAMALPVAALAEKAPALDRPESFRKLIECRTITDNAERLSCFDRQAAILDTAERNSEVMIVDRQQAAKAKKGLFGLSLPSIGGLFGKDDKVTGEEVNAIESTIKSVAMNKAGKLVIVIEDGARWVQIDTQSVRSPKAGQPIRIRRAAMGSFFANINNQTAIRMRREN